MKYYIDEHQGPEDAFTAKKLSDRWDRWAAQEAAEDYHSRHDGWEDTWPLTFVLLDDEGNEKAWYLVEREAVPEFYATILTK